MVGNKKMCLESQIEIPEFPVSTAILFYFRYFFFLNFILRRRVVLAKLSILREKCICICYMPKRREKLLEIVKRMKSVKHYERELQLE